MKRWYAVQTKPRQETVAQANLQRQAFEVYLPLLTVSRRRRGRWTEVVECLFPRYLFTRIDTAIESVSVIRSTRGVTDLVRFGEQLLHLDEGIVKELKDRERASGGLHRPGGGRFHRGDRVRAVHGAFTDVEGIFLAEKGQDRVVILMHLLNRDTRVAIARNDIVPVSS